MCASSNSLSNETLNSIIRSPNTVSMHPRINMALLATGTSILSSSGWIPNISIGKFAKSICYAGWLCAALALFMKLDIDSLRVSTTDVTNRH